MNTTNHSACGCPCHKMKGFFVALIGLTVLLGNLEILSSKVVGIAWPVMLMLIGMKKMMPKGFCKCCADG